MRSLSDLFSRKALTGSTAVVEAFSDRTANILVPLGGAQAGKAINAAFLRGQSATYGWLYMHRPAVREVVDFVARNVAQLPLKLYERLDETERRRDTDHPAILSMDRPDDGRTTGDQLITRFVTDFLVYDNAYLLKFRQANGGPLRLVRLPPPFVQVNGGLFTADLYRVWRRDGSHFDVMPEDVIHWHGYNPQDPLMGLSRLETLRDTLTEDQVSQATTVELMKNGLKGGHIERPVDAPEWSEEARQRFQESWKNQRAMSPRRDPVLEEGMKWVPTAITPKDAELLAGRRFTVEEVAGVYGVPPEVLGLVPGARDLPEARKQVYEDVLPPITGDMAGQFDQDILQAEFMLSDYYFEFDINEKLRGNIEGRAAALTATTGRPWRTVNEARALENLAPIDGGDELTIPLNVALGELPAPNVMPPQNPLGPPQDGSHRTPPGQPPVEPVPAKGLVKSSDPILQLAPRRASDMTRQQRYIDEAKGLLDAYYTRQARVLRRKALEFDGARWDRELAADLTDLLSSIVEREGGIYVARLAGDDFDMRMVRNYLKATALGVASAINDVTKADIEAMGLDDAVGRARGERAAVAATSLGARSTIFAREEAAKQAPQYELRTKTWVADTQRHAEFDGDTVPIGEDWPAGFAPGSPPNCACTAVIS